MIFNVLIKKITTIFNTYNKNVKNFSDSSFPAKLFTNFAKNLKTTI